MNTSKYVGARGSSTTSRPSASVATNDPVRSLLDELALADLFGRRDRVACAARRRPPVSVSRPAPRRAARIPDRPRPASSWRPSRLLAWGCRFLGGILESAGSRHWRRADEAPRRRRGESGPRATMRPARCGSAARYPATGERGGNRRLANPARRRRGPLPGRGGHDRHDCRIRTNASPDSTADAWLSETARSSQAYSRS